MSLYPTSRDVFVPPGPKCPVLTDRPVSLQEACGMEVPEIRAYKLGKKRWSYNQIELVVVEAGGSRQVHVQQASAMSGNEDYADGSVLYHVLLANGLHLRLRAFLVYDGCGETADRTMDDNGLIRKFEWTQVDRCACRRGCTGPVLRSIQRYGKLGKRRWNGSLTPDVSDRTNINMKDPRYLYLSFDEAGTHVGVQNFRMVTAVYDELGEVLLGTSVSPPLRVVANNDVPTGAAHIQHLVAIHSAWHGWEGVEENPENPALRPMGVKIGDGGGGGQDHLGGFQVDIQVTPMRSMDVQGSARPSRSRRRSSVMSESASMMHQDYHQQQHNRRASHLMDVGEEGQDEVDDDPQYVPPRSHRAAFARQEYEYQQQQQQQQMDSSSLGGTHVASHYDASSPKASMMNVSGGYQNYQNYHQNAAGATTAEGSFFTNGGHQQQHHQSQIMQSYTMQHNNNSMAHHLPPQMMMQFQQPTGFSPPLQQQQQQQQYPYQLPTVNYQPKLHHPIPTNAAGVTFMIPATPAMPLPTEPLAGGLAAQPDPDDPLLAFMEMMMQLPGADNDGAPVLELPTSPLSGLSGSAGDGLMAPTLSHPQQHAELLQLWQEQHGTAALRATTTFFKPEDLGPDQMDLMGGLDVKCEPAQSCSIPSAHISDVNLYSQMNANGMLATPTPSILDDLLCNIQTTLDGAAEALLLDDATYNGVKASAPGRNTALSEVFAR